MEKYNLSNITFIILLRLDSVERIQNFQYVFNELLANFNTNIIVGEVDSLRSGIVEGIINKRASYVYFEDEDNILFKTKYINLLSLMVSTQFMCLLDADIVVERNRLIEASLELKKGIDVVYPYCGICYQVPSTIKNVFFKLGNNVDFLYDNINALPRLYQQMLVGGIVLMKTEQYYSIGKENEKHYGWGNDDYDRFYRFIKKNNTIVRLSCPLFHLFHPVKVNSSFHSLFHKATTYAELEHTKKEAITNKLLIN